MIQRALQFLSIFLIFLIALGSPKILHGKSFHETITETYTHDAAYILPSKDDLEKAKNLFYHFFSSVDFQIDVKSWDTLGFEIERMGSFLIVKEKKTDQVGKGVYVFNTSRPSQMVIEAPHRPSDKYTGTLAIQLMEEGHFLAAALNTVHRKKANFTKEQMTYFNAFTEAFGEAFPYGSVLQLHGFEGDHHQSSTDLILSATIFSPPPLFYQYGEYLSKLPLKFSLFPRDIKILGGTKNINAKKLQSSGNRGLFLHLEMSLALRDKLKNNKEFRKKFFGCFVKRD